MLLPRLLRQSYLVVLQDGTMFYGEAIGYKGTTTGELCFNTG